MDLGIETDLTPSLAPPCKNSSRTTARAISPHTTVTHLQSSWPSRAHARPPGSRLSSPRTSCRPLPDVMSRFYCGECSSAPRRAFVILALQLLGSILYSHNGFASAPHACDASAIARGHSTFLRGARFCITVSMPRDIRHISRTIVSSTLSRRWVPHLVWDPAGRDGARRSHLVNRIVACKTRCGEGRGAVWASGVRSVRRDAESALALACRTRGCRSKQPVHLPPLLQTAVDRR